MRAALSPGIDATCALDPSYAPDGMDRPNLNDDAGGTVRYDAAGSITSIGMEAIAADT